MNADSPIPAEWATFTAEQVAVLLALPLTLTLTAAADQVGVSRMSVWRWQRDDPIYRDALLRQKEQAADRLEAELFRRAMEGKGQMPDTLGIFLLKGYRPQFRDSYTVKHEGAVLHGHLDLASMSPADRAALLDVAASQARKQIGTSHPEADAG